MIFVRNRLLQAAVDGLVVLLALSAAYLVRFEGTLPRFYLKQLLLLAPYVVLLRLGLYMAFGVYRLVWRYISLKDLPRIASAIVSGTALLLLLRLLFPGFLALTGLVFNHSFTRIPYGVLLTEMVFTGGGLLTVRLLWRILMERRAQTRQLASSPSARPKRALLVGAGSAGVMIAKEIVANPAVGFTIVGFLDDDRTKQGTIIQGYTVLGPSAELPRLAKAREAELVIISMANVSPSVIRHVVALAEEADLPVQIIPGLHEILSGKVNISKIRAVAIEDLLGRKPVHLEEDAIGAFLTGRRVLITGAGGSIGSEIARQVARYTPRRLILLDQAENNLFHLLRHLSAAGVDFAEPRIGNVADAERMTQVLEECRPEVIFHAAAHKHVPLMEQNPGEALRNNVLGSRTVADLAHRFGAEAFVMISTDKAVNPTSVMGASKRAAELYVQSLAAASSTRFITVRFGNVLGSEGSVIPIFKEQIAQGGPVTVTHPDMKRYFMTIPEASQLVLQAATMGEGGEIFILEMGEPIKIADLARDLIRLSGYRPDDEIDIVFSGVRPGEKLYEEINLSAENATKTKHPRIWVGKTTSTDHASLAARLDALVAMARKTDKLTLLRALKELIPEFTPEELITVGAATATEAPDTTAAATDDDATTRTIPRPVPAHGPSTP